MRKYLMVIIAIVLMGVTVSIYARQKSSFNTKDIAPEIKGMGGHIEMLVELDSDGNIKDVKVLSHNETPEYAAGISDPEFLAQFKGKGVDDGFIVGEDIDGITGATISSGAVAETLKACLERINNADESGRQASGVLTRLRDAGLEPKEAEYYRVMDE